MASTEDDVTLGDFGVPKSSGATTSTTSSRGSREKRNKDGEAARGRPSKSATSSSASTSGDMDTQDPHPCYVFCKGAGVVYTSGIGPIDPVSLPKSFRGAFVEVAVPMHQEGCLMIPAEMNEEQCRTIDTMNRELPMTRGLQIYTAGALRVRKQVYAFLVVAKDSASARRVFSDQMAMLTDAETEYDDLPLHQLSVRESCTVALLDLRNTRSLPQIAGDRQSEKRKRSPEQDSRDESMYHTNGHGSSGNYDLSTSSKRTRLFDDY